MKQDPLHHLIERYSTTLHKTQHQVTQILCQMNIEKSIDSSTFNTMVTDATQKLIEKWKNQAKTLRTAMVYQVIPNYPDALLEPSLLLDAMINLLDDLYDEILSKDDLTHYVIEVLRILALFTPQKLTTHQQEHVTTYFTKILSIALLESIYIHKIHLASNSAEKIEYVIECYEIKSRDLDIFLELPLLEFDIRPKILEKIVSFGHIYRALSIIIKDINDLDHDLKHHIKTPMVLLSQDTEKCFREQIDAVLNQYLQKSTQDQGKPETPLEATIINNIKEEIHKQICILKKTYQNL